MYQLPIARRHIPLMSISSIVGNSVSLRWRRSLLLHGLSRMFVIPYSLFYFLSPTSQITTLLTVLTLSLQIYDGLFCFAFFRSVVESVWIHFSNVRHLQTVSVAERPQNHDQTTIITQNHCPPHSRYKIICVP